MGAQRVNSGTAVASLRNRMPAWARSQRRRDEEEAALPPFFSSSRRSSFLQDALSNCRVVAQHGSFLRLQPSSDVLAEPLGLKPRPIFIEGLWARRSTCMVAFRTCLSGGREQPSLVYLELYSPLHRHSSPRKLIPFCVQPKFERVGIDGPPSPHLRPSRTVPHAVSATIIKPDIHATTVDRDRMISFRWVHKDI